MSVYYVSSGITKTNITLNKNDYMRVYDGGEAYGTIVNSGGSVYVFNSGTMNRNTVNSGGSVYVNSGGQVNSTTINRNGFLFVSSGGIANSTTVNSAGSFYVSNGGIANSTTVNFGVIIYISSGGIANSTTVNSGGILRVSSSGTANSIDVNSGGFVYVASGGTANSISWTPCVGYVGIADGAYVTFASEYSGVYYGLNNVLLSQAQNMDSTEINGSMYVMPGGIANSTTVNSGGSVFVSNGGIANSTTVNSGGSVFVSNGGIANSTMVNSGGRVYVSSGGTTNNTIITASSWLYVSNGGTAINIIWTPCVGHIYTDNQGGAALSFVSEYSGVYYGGGDNLESTAIIMENKEIQSSQEMYVMANGLANSTTVYLYGIMYVSSGGTANNTIIDSNGFLRVESGGTAAHIVASSGARLDLSLAPNTYIEGTYADSAFEIKDGAVSYYSVNSGSILRISSGGKASRNYVYGGAFFVSCGGEVNSTTMSGGSFYIFNGGIANNTVMNGGGMSVFRGGVANNIVMNGGEISVFSGGEAKDIVENGGYVYIEKGANVTFMSHSFSGLALNSATVHSGTTAIKTTVKRGGNLHISSGGTAINITASGSVHISSGGIANSTTVSSGYLEVSSGGTANIVTVQGYGYHHVYSGGIANSTTISNGYLDVYSGGTANDATIKGGNMHVSGGMANNATVNNGSMSVYSGEANNATVNGGSMYVSGGTANNATIKGGNMTVSRGTANNALVNGGGMQVFSGTADNAIVNGGNMYVVDGSANNTTVSKGTLSLSSYIASDIRIYSGGNVSAQNTKLTGKITIANGGVIHAGQGTVIDFDISRLAPSMGALLNNLSLIQDDAPAYTLTVSDVQWNGTYKLAQGVTEFDNLISVKSTANQTIHMVAVDETANVDGVEYTLKLTGDTLSVTVTGGQDIPIIPVSADITVPTNQDVMVTADFSDDAVMREFSFDNETWYVYTEPVKFSENGSVYFLGKDQRGYVNEIGNYEVTNIDTMPPSIPGDQASEINGYTADLSWSAASDAGGGTITYEYRIATDNTYSQNLKSGTTETCSITVDNLKSGTYYWSICAKDAAGNASEWSESKTITTVDTVAPDIPANLVCLVESITTLSVSWDEASDDSLGVGLNRYEIQLASDEAFDSVVKSFSTTETTATVEALSKGDYYLRVCSVDNAGNKSDWTATEAFTIETDTIPPTISDIKADITEPTKENVTVTATFNDNYALETSQYKIGNDGEWTDYKNGVIVTENAVVYFRAVDTTGNETEATYEVKNIDRIKPVITLDGNTQTPVQQTTLTASTDDGSAILYRINNSGEWTTYTGTIAVLANASYSFKATDTAGNTGTAEITFKNIDTIPPVLTLTADTVTLSNSVTLTAETNEETVISYSSDNKNWTIYEGPFEVKANGRYYFKAVDVAGNVDNAEIEFTNIDVVAPTAPTGLRSFVDGQDVALVWNVSTDDFSGIKEYLVTYSLDGQEFTARTANSNYVLNNADFGSYSWSVLAVDFAGNESAIVAGDAFTVSGFKPYTVEYSADNFEHVIRFTVTTPTLDSFRMPTGTYQLRVRQEGSSEWMTGDSIVAAEFDDAPQFIKSDADGNADVFFANPVGTWESCYVAQHVGSINDWAGTNEFASVFGKNKLADIIEGSTDANILLMTDDENGDTLFVDDIYTASPGNMAEQQARIAQIDEIRAGSGNDIVDMTSQQFEYIGDGLTIRGGEGNDTIWANKGDNWLFGDAGNDRIVGASGNDVIAGGIGNDRMHGGGGNDIFTFCDNWGVDNVEQLATGSVILWFAEGSKNNWDEATLTYNDGDNIVKVSGVAAEKVTLKFGDDGSAQFASLTSMGAFFDATTERIFEESGKGILASL
jgi:autotransporter passenger strand-loop-strand repeat protein